MSCGMRQHAPESKRLGAGRRLAVNRRMRKFIKIITEGADDQHLPATPENIARAQAFVLKMWRERAAEMGREQPLDLSSSCKFTSMFAQHVFGGEIRGNYDHQFVSLPNGEVLDLNIDAEDVKAMSSPHEHDKRFFNNPKHKASMASCLPRVEKWVEEFRREIA